MKWTLIDRNARSSSVSVRPPLALTWRFDERGRLIGRWSDTSQSLVAHEVQAA
jgi:hypothetical protein